MRVMMGQFAMVCTRRKKVNEGKSKVMVVNGEEGFMYEVHVAGVHLEHVSEFKYLRCFGRIRHRWSRMQ